MRARVRGSVRGSLRKLTFREPCARKLAGNQRVTVDAVTSIAAIPPPSAYVRSSAPSGTAKLRQMLDSDAIAVRPIQPIPDEERRLKDPKLGETQQAPPEFSEDAVRRGRGPSGEEVRSRPLGPPGAGDQRVGGGFRPEGPPPPPPPPPPQSAASPSTGFLTQSIAQEAIGNGLHIEPWGAAIGAYRRAAASPRESLVSNISV